MQRNKTPSKKKYSLYWRGLEDDDCILYRGVRPHPNNKLALTVRFRIRWLYPVQMDKTPPKNRLTRQGIEYVNCIPCRSVRSFSTKFFWALGNMKYAFIAVTLRSTLTRNGCIYLGSIYEIDIYRSTWYHMISSIPIDIYWNTWYHIPVWKTLKKPHKNVNINVQFYVFPQFLGLKQLRTGWHAVKINQSINQEMLILSHTQLLFTKLLW